MTPEESGVPEPAEAQTKPEAAAAPRRFPMWLAALPALLTPLVLMVNGMRQFGRAADAIQPNAGQHAPRTACVETYGITLNGSEYYVRQIAPGISMAKPNAPVEFSTVLKGMARNNCGADLKNVHVRLSVHDDAGKKGDGTVVIEKMAIGEAKPFEKAWMGHVTSYEVHADQ